MATGGRTERLGLNKWGPKDPLFYQEWNDNFQKIDDGHKQVTEQLTETNTKKADKTEVNILATAKADKTYVDTELAKKATPTDITNAITSKADKTEVAVERARIDSFTKLAAGSTTGDAELIDARVDVDGVTYANVGGAVRGQFNKLKTGLGKYYLQEIVMTNGYNINLSIGVGNVVSLTPESVASYRYAVVDCVEGDTFTINGVGGENPRLWGFIDSDNKLLSVANRVLSVNDNLMLAAPKNATKLIINDSKSGRKSYIGSDLTKTSLNDRKKVNELEINLTEVQSSLYGKKITMTDGYIIALGVGVGNTVSLTPEVLATYRYAIVDCVEGDLFTINGIGGENPRLWGFIDDNNILLSVSATGLNISNNMQLEAPKNAKKLIINDAKSDRTSYAGYDLTKITRINKEKIDNVDSAFYGKQIEMKNNYYIALGSGVGSVINMTPLQLGVYRYAVADCSENDMFIINGTGGENPRLWGFVDANNVLIAVSDAVKTEKDLLLITPKNASKLIINDLKTGGTCYDGANIEKTLAHTIISSNELSTTLKTSNESLAQTSSRVADLGADIYEVRKNPSMAIPAKELSIGTGNPTFATYTKGAARVPYWAMSGSVSGESLTSYVDAFGGEWGAVKISAVIMNPSGTPIETDSEVLQAQIHPIVYGQAIDSSSILANPVVHKTGGQGVMEKIELSDVIKLDTSNPFIILIHRKSENEKDTNTNPIGIVSLEVTPVKPIELQYADKYNAWPFISTVGNKLVCVYSKGLNHEDGTTPDIYVKTSVDGKRWSPEKLIISTSKVRDTITGKGTDINGSMLMWLRKGPPGKTATHHLYRTDNGETFELISSPTFAVIPTHIGDIFHVANVGLLAFYNDAATYSWGVVKSLDNGVTWTQLSIEESLPKESCPTEISGAYIGNGKIIAVGRKEYSATGDPYAQFQIQSSDYGATWTKTHTNISDIALSTPSIVYNSLNDLLSLYYFHRGVGALRLRTVKASEIWDNPLSWPTSKVVAYGSTNTQDTGNVNAVAFGDKHIAAFYSGDATNTAIYATIVMP